MLLAKEYHNKQHRAHPNVIQAFLQAVSYCEPLPSIPIELVKFLGKTHNVWHTAIRLLEDKAAANPRDQSVSLPLAELYHLLSEDDACYR